MGEQTDGPPNSGLAIAFIARNNNNTMQLPPSLLLYRPFGGGGGIAELLAIESLEGLSSIWIEIERVWQCPLSGQWPGGRPIINGSLALFGQSNNKRGGPQKASVSMYESAKPPPPRPRQAFCLRSELASLLSLLGQCLARSPSRWPITILPTAEQTDW